MYNKKLNTIVIVMDQLIAYHNMPEELKKNLKGYNAFKKLGIEFTNIHNNRQACSPSRASFISSQINTGIQDNIDQAYQYDSVPSLSDDFDTIGKSLKRNNIDITAYYGKEHIQSSFATNSFITPLLNINTVGCLKHYGFDEYNLYGDTFYSPNLGIGGDNTYFDSIINYEIEGKKRMGVIPFLEKRKNDKKSYHLQFHIVNPHDTQHFWQNFEKTPKSSQLQFWAPFLQEQTTDAGIKDPYYFDNFFPNAYIDIKELTTNYFEDNYNDYSNEKKSLPFLESYNFDYCIDSKTNSIFPWFVGMYKTMAEIFSIAKNQTDIKSWKNLINNYYGLIIMTDNYIYKIYKFLEDNNMLNDVSVIITADHGDCMSAHGLKQKGYPFKECVNVPFVVYSPYISEDLKNTNCNILGSLLDLAPTIEILSNVLNKSNEFIGESLLYWNNNNLYPRNNDKQVFHIVNSWMLTNSYFTFPIWYSLQPQSVKDRVVRVPNNYYEYLSNYTMIIEKYNGFSYKFVRYFCIEELFLYNFIYNTNLYVDGKPPILNINMIKIYVDINFYTQNLLYFIALDEKLKINGLSNFTFEQGFNLLKFNDNGENKDNILLTLYMLFIIRYVSTKINDIFILPGSFTNYNILKNQKRYYFMCFDLVNDPNELYNLADPNYPERGSDILFELLNSRMNEYINNNLKNFTYTTPNAINAGIFYNMKINSESLTTYSDFNLYTILTLYGLNNWDATMQNEQKIIEKILISI